jgi:hypothetical protein
MGSGDDTRRAARRRRRAAIAVGLIALALAVVGWGIPNVAGSAFVEVRLVVVPILSAGPGPVHTIVLGETAPMDVSRLRLQVRVEGQYPLPLVVAGGAQPLRVELRARDETGVSHLVWAIDDTTAALDAGSDSPAGSGGSRAYLVRPGTVDLDIGPAAGVALIDEFGVTLSPGRYELRAVAFGIAGGSLPLQVIE